MSDFWGFEKEFYAKNGEGTLKMMFLQPKIRTNNQNQ